MTELISQKLRDYEERLIEKCLAECSPKNILSGNFVLSL